MLLGLVELVFLGSDQSQRVVSITVVGIILTDVLKQLARFGELIGSEISLPHDVVSIAAHIGLSILSDDGVVVLLSFGKVAFLVGHVQKLIVELGHVIGSVVNLDTRSVDLLGDIVHAQIFEGASLIVGRSIGLAVGRIANDDLAKSICRRQVVALDIETHGFLESQFRLTNQTSIALGAFTLFASWSKAGGRLDIPKQTALLVVEGKTVMGHIQFNFQIPQIGKTLGIACKGQHRETFTRLLQADGNIGRYVIGNTSGPCDLGLSIVSRLRSDVNHADFSTCFHRTIESQPVQTQIQVARIVVVAGHHGILQRCANLQEAKLAVLNGIQKQPDISTERSRCRAEVVHVDYGNIGSQSQPMEKPVTVTQENGILAEGSVLSCWRIVNRSAVDKGRHTNRMLQTKRHNCRYVVQASLVVDGTIYARHDFNLVSISNVAWIDEQRRIVAEATKVIELLIA